MKVQFFHTLVTLNEVETNRPHVIPFLELEDAVNAARELRASGCRNVVVYVWDLTDGKYFETGY